MTSLLALLSPNARAPHHEATMPAPSSRQRTYADTVATTRLKSNSPYSARSAGRTRDRIAGGKSTPLGPLRKTGSREQLNGFDRSPLPPLSRVRAARTMVG